jgi:hypothetical protein
MVDSVRDTVGPSVGRGPPPVHGFAALRLDGGPVDAHLHACLAGDRGDELEGRLTPFAGKIVLPPPRITGITMS